MYLVTTEQMRRLEQAAVDAGATWSGLMEHAGWGVAHEALRLLGDPQRRRVVVLVGPGNNGGDGLVVARHLHDAGATVQLYIWQRANIDQDKNWQRCRERGLEEMQAADDIDYSGLRRWLSTATLVVDALLGMGVSREVTGSLATIVQLVNTLCTAGNQSADQRLVPGTPVPPRVLAIDLPTGIHSDTGAVMGVAIRADVTVATGLLKRGLTLYPGKGFAGAVTVVDIGIPLADLETIMSKVMTDQQARTLLPTRPADAHKGTFGKVMVVAGSLFYPGAAVLATAGAGRVGVGLVTLAAARSVLLASGRGPEVTLLPLPEADLGILGAAAADEVHKHLAGYTALLVGPGLGHEEPTGLFMQRLLGLESPHKRSRVGFRIQHDEPDHPTKATNAVELPPTVIDADGLNLLATIEDWSQHVPPGKCILTPHPGEMKRLLKVDELDPDLVQVVTGAATRWNQVVVLKGATTVIAAPDGRSMVNANGNPALATAGTGDVLAGVIAGLLAQGMELFPAATLGVYLHAAAGALVREELGDTGALASDLLLRLPLAIKRLRMQP